MPYTYKLRDVDINLTQVFCKDIKNNPLFRIIFFAKTDLTQILLLTLRGIFFIKNAFILVVYAAIDLTQAINVDINLACLLYTEISSRGTEFLSSEAPFRSMLYFVFRFDFTSRRSIVASRTQIRNADRGLPDA